MIKTKFLLIILNSGLFSKEKNLNDSLFQEEGFFKRNQYILIIISCVIFFIIFYRLWPSKKHPSYRSDSDKNQDANLIITPLVKEKGPQDILEEANQNISNDKSELDDIEDEVLNKKQDNNSNLIITPLVKEKGPQDILEEANQNISNDIKNYYFYNDIENYLLVYPYMEDSFKINHINFKTITEEDCKKYAEKIFYKQYPISEYPTRESYRDAYFNPILLIFKQILNVNLLLNLNKKIYEINKKIQGPIKIKLTDTIFVQIIQNIQNPITNNIIIYDNNVQVLEMTYDLTKKKTLDEYYFFRTNENSIVNKKIEKIYLNESSFSKKRLTSIPSLRFIALLLENLENDNFIIRE